MDHRKSVSNNSLMLSEVIQGLQKSQKTLPSKYFYDKRGSWLFEEITRLEEYYLTRTELTIMQNNLSEIEQYVGKNVILVEPGSGSSKKTQLLLDEWTGLTGYVPVDISEQYLTNIVHSLKEKYPNLPIKPVCADYTQSFEVPDFKTNNAHYLLFYPGSTIGNFCPTEAQQFLKSISQILNPEGGLLIGVDLQKDINLLKAAYNDREGITATFNKNILRHINRKLNADFEPDRFAHQAIYNRKENRMEMHLKSKAAQTVTIDGKQIHFEQDETIQTENSYKYTLDSFRKLVDPWFSVQKVWTDDDNYFSVQYLKKE